MWHFLMVIVMVVLLSITNQSSGKTDNIKIIHS